MSNVIKGNFQKVERDYGYKKISEKGVNDLQTLQKFLLTQQAIVSNDMPMVLNMLSQVLDNEITHKHFMTKGNKEI